MASITLPPIEGFFNHFITSQFRTTCKPPPPTTNLTGQTAIITGSYTGLGLAAAQVLLGLHLSHLIIAVRSVEKGEDAASTLQKAYPKAQIEVWALDMLSYDSIQAFARKCETLPRLNIVIFNAGMAATKFEINPSTRHEKTFQVNYLSTALLAILLLPILKAKSPPGMPGRMTFVASALAWQAALPNKNSVPIFPTFDDPKGWNFAASSERYAASKLMVLMLVFRLGNLISPNDVIVNAVEPGLVGGTGLHRNASGAVVIILKIMGALAARTVQQGAYTYADAAVVKGPETHGSFVVNFKIYP